MIPIAKPNLGEEEKRAVLEVMESGQLAQGAKVAEFEKRFAEYVGRGHGIAVNSGTSALHIALLAHGIGRGDEVVVPALTFFASASTVLLCGGTPTFADVDRDLGQRAKYDHILVGYNYRMTEIAAAIGLVQLRKLDGWVRKRRENAARLTKGISQIEGLAPPVEGNWMLHAYYQYIVRVEDGFPLTRDEIVRRLNDEGIGARASYPSVLYRQKAFRKRPKNRAKVAEDVIPRLVEVPVHPLVGAADITTILGALEALR